MQPFRQTIVETPTLDAFRPVLEDYEVMMVTVLQAIVSRYRAHPEYHFIDTKLSMLTGEDFPVPAEATTDFKSRNAIFAWIQGRGLESLVGHARWLDRCSVLTGSERAELAEGLSLMIGEVFLNMERIRARNNGRLSFTMTPEGDPFDMGPGGRRRPVDIANRPCGFGDLFYAKGMLAAASFLNDQKRMDDAKDCFRRVLDDVMTNRFESDSFSFDPKNPVEKIPGRLAQGPSMIAVGGCALFAELTGEPEWFDVGEKLTRYLLEHHANLGQFEQLEVYDYFVRQKANTTLLDSSVS